MDTDVLAQENHRLDEENHRLDEENNRLVQENNKLAEENHRLNENIRYVQDKYNSLNQNFYQLSTKLKQYEDLGDEQGYNTRKLQSPSEFRSNEAIQDRRQKFRAKQFAHAGISPVPGETARHRKLRENALFDASQKISEAEPATDLKPDQGGGYNNKKRKTKKRKTKRRKTKKRKLSKRRR